MMARTSATGTCSIGPEMPKPALLTSASTTPAASTARCDRRVVVDVEDEPRGDVEVVDRLDPPSGRDDLVAALGELDRRGPPEAGRAARDQDPTHTPVRPLALRAPCSGATRQGTCVIATRSMLARSTRDRAGVRLSPRSAG